MLIGHEKHIQYFNRLLKRGALAHAYLFHGPEHVGKFSFAKYIAGLLGGEEIILDTEHTLVSKKETRKDIPVEDIRELKRICSFSVPSGTHRIVIINEAEKMNGEAANAFLKLLEEPGERTIFFLITSAPDLLPSTIASRAVPRYFPIPPRRVLEAFIQSRVNDEKTEEMLIRLSFGKPGLVVKFLEDGEFFEQEKKFAGSLESAWRGSLSDAFLFSEKAAADKETSKKTAEYLMHLLRRKLIGAVSSSEALLCAEKIKRVSETALALETTNVNPRLALDAMFIEAK